MESLRAYGLSIVQLELVASASSIIYHELAGCCWPIVYHECTGSLRLGVAVWVLLEVFIRILLLLIDYCPTGAIIDVKLTWLSGVEADLELLLANGFLVVEPEIIWAASVVDHEVAGASRAIIDHKLAACTGSIVYGKLIRTTTSVIHHELTASSRSVVDGELIWATSSVIGYKFASTRQFLLRFSTHLYELWLLQISFILTLINKIILWNWWLGLVVIHVVWIRPHWHIINWSTRWKFAILCFGHLLKVLFLQR